MVLEFFSNNAVGNILTWAFLGICGFVAFVKIVQLVSSLKSFFDSKASLADEKASDIRANKITLYEDLVDIITTAAQIEVLNVLSQYNTLNARYPMQNIDNDIKTISTNVYNLIDKNRLITMRLPVTTEYIQKLILGTSKRILIESAVKMNGTLDEGGQIVFTV